MNFGTGGLGTNGPDGILKAEKQEPGGLKPQLTTNKTTTMATSPLKQIQTCRRRLLALSRCAPIALTSPTLPPTNPQNLLSPRGGAGPFSGGRS